MVVRDANASAEWGREKLGFAIHRIADQAIRVAPPGDRFVLHRCEGLAPVEPGETGIALLSDELSALSARLRAVGVPSPEPYREGSGAGSAKFADRDGNIFRLLSVPSPFVRSTLALRAPPERRSVARERSFPRTAVRKSSRRGRGKERHRSWPARVGRVPRSPGRSVGILPAGPPSSGPRTPPECADNIEIRGTLSRPNRDFDVGGSPMHFPLGWAMNTSGGVPSVPRRGDR